MFSISHLRLDIIKKVQN